MALDQKIKDQLSAYLGKINNSVEITYYENQTTKSNEMVELLNEVNQMSTFISLKAGNDKQHRSPAFCINQPSHETGIVFAGIPMGHEFTSFILAIYKQVVTL